MFFVEFIKTLLEPYGDARGSALASSARQAHTASTHALADAADDSDDIKLSAGINCCMTKGNQAILLSISFMISRIDLARCVNVVHGPSTMRRWPRCISERIGFRYDQSLKAHARRQKLLQLSENYWFNSFKTADILCPSKTHARVYVAKTHVTSQRG